MAVGSGVNFSAFDDEKDKVDINTSSFDDKPTEKKKT